MIECYHPYTQQSERRIHCHGVQGAHLIPDHNEVKLAFCIELVGTLNMSP